MDDYPSLSTSPPPTAAELDAKLSESSDVEPPASAPVPEPQEGDRTRSPEPGWPWWTAPIALLGALLLATVASFVVDLPALAFGVSLTASHTPPGLAIADTFVQDVAFVVAAVYCAQIGARKVRSWQFGLRTPGAGWRHATAMIVGLLVAYLLLGALWTELVHPKSEELLEQLGTNEGTALLLLSAGLTCVIAPVGEEMLFRGYIFTALRSWRGTLPAALITGVVFGGIHYGSAPALDLVPLGVLGFGLCLLYRYSGSLYSTMTVHSLNNSLAFASLEHWGLEWRSVLLACASLLAIAGLARGARIFGLIAPSAAPARAAA